MVRIRCGERTQRAFNWFLATMLENVSLEETRVIRRVRTKDAHVFGLELVSTKHVRTSSTMFDDRFNVRRGELLTVNTRK